MTELIEKLSLLEDELICIARDFESCGVKKSSQRKLDTIISKVDILKWELIDDERYK